MLISMRIQDVLVLGVSLIACTDDVQSVGETVSAVTSNNRLSANRLSANRLSANRLQLHASSSDLIATEEGREVLTFLVGCAVSPDQTLVGSFGGTTYEFHGELGLASHWLDRPLDRKGAGWVSACLFARVNANAVEVEISLRGNHEQLAVTADEAANWSLQEGAFYGNYFTPENQPIDWVACRGSAQASGEYGGLVDRDCAEPDPENPGKTICGFTYAGDCGDFAARYACKKYDSGGTFYKKCYASAAFAKKTRNAREVDNSTDDAADDGSYRQVITTYVTP